MKKHIIFFNFLWFLPYALYGYTVKIKNNSGKNVLVVVSHMYDQIVFKAYDDTLLTKFKTDVGCISRVIVAYEDKNMPFNPIFTRKYDGKVPIYLLRKEIQDAIKARNFGGKLLYNKRESNPCISKGIMIKKDLTVDVKDLYLWTKFP